PATAGPDCTGKPVERGRGPPLGAEQRSAARSEFLRCTAQHRRIFTHVHERFAQLQRQAYQLVQSHVHGYALLCCVGEPLPQPCPRGRQVEHQNAAGQIVGDNIVVLPQCSTLFGVTGSGHAGTLGKGCQHQAGQGVLVTVEGLGITGGVHGQVRQEQGRIVRGAFCDGLQGSHGPPQSVGVMGVDQPGRIDLGLDPGQPFPIPRGLVERARTRRGEYLFPQSAFVLSNLTAMAQRGPKRLQKFDQPDLIPRAQGGVEAGNIDLEAASGGPVIGTEKTVEPTVLLARARDTEGPRQLAVVFFQVNAGLLQERGKAGFAKPFKTQLSSVSASRVPAVDWGTKRLGVIPRSSAVSSSFPAKPASASMVCSPSQSMSRAETVWLPLSWCMS